jgi:hypothetical protein
MSVDWPLSMRERMWIDGSLEWFGREFGLDAATAAVEVPESMIPPGYIPVTPAAAPVIVRASHRMGVHSAELNVHLIAPDPAGRHRRVVGHYTRHNGRYVIGLDQAVIADPVCLTAVVAHELSHVRLLGERRITLPRSDHERLTELLTVYLGLGVFTANAAVRFPEVLTKAEDASFPARLGFLTERELGYALARHALLREETDPDWAHHLDAGPRAHFEACLERLTGDDATPPPGAGHAVRPGPSEGTAGNGPFHPIAHHLTPLTFSLPGCDAASQPMVF